MYQVNDDKSIYVTRGDEVYLSVMAEDEGKAYIFQPGDVVRIKVFAKKDCDSVALQKDFPVTTETDTVEIFLDGNDTKIGKVISKPVDYWYEVELNPETNPITIIGYDEDGAKVFKLFPEGRDLTEDDPIFEPDDIPVIDEELDLTSKRPVQNMVVARAMLRLEGSVKKTAADVESLRKSTAASEQNLLAQIDVERKRINTFTSLKDGSTTGDAELTDIRVGAGGIVYDTAGEAVREQVSELWGGLNDRIRHLHLKPTKTYADKYLNPSDGGMLVVDGASVEEYVVTGGKEYYFAAATIGRDYVMFYDSDYTYLCSLSALAPSFNRVAKIPENAFYMRIAKNKNEVSSGISVVVVAAEDYYTYGLASGVINENVFVPEAKAADRLADFPAVYMRSNLLNPATIEAGVYCNYMDGKKTEHEGYFATDKIRIAEKQTLKFYDTKMKPIIARMVAAFDKAGNFVGGVDFATEYTQIGAEKYIIVTFDIGTETQTMIADSSVTEFLPYRETGYIVPDIIEDSRQTSSLLGKNAHVLEQASIAIGSTVNLDDFPAYIKNGMAINFSGKFADFGYIKIGKGLNSYRGRWFYIDNKQIVHHSYESKDVIVETIQHNLSITDYISVVIDVKGKDCNLFINTTSGTFAHTFDWDHEACGTVFMINGTAMTDCKFGATSSKFSCPLWAFGDSYFGVNNQRVIGQLKNLGFIDNILVNGLSGQNSSGAYNDLLKCLNFGTPKYLLWCLGMNDDANRYANYLAQLKELCKAKGITLILTKIPTVPNISKEELNEHVTNSGNRYIDSYRAVGANANGTWYSGYLSGDNVHPTERGAQALAMQMLVDVPEIMQY